MHISRLSLVKFCFSLFCVFQYYNFSFWVCGEIIGVYSGLRARPKSVFILVKIFFPVSIISLVLLMHAYLGSLVFRACLPMTLRRCLDCTPMLTSLTRASWPRMCWTPSWASSLRTALVEGTRRGRLWWHAWLKICCRSFQKITAHLT